MSGPQVPSSRSAREMPSQANGREGRSTSQGVHVGSCQVLTDGRISRPGHNTSLQVDRASDRPASHLSTAASCFTYDLRPSFLAYIHYRAPRLSSMKMDLSPAVLLNLHSFPGLKFVDNGTGGKNATDTIIQPNTHFNFHAMF